MTGREYKEFLYHDYMIVDSYLIKEYSMNIDDIKKRILAVTDEEKYRDIICRGVKNSQSTEGIESCIMIPGARIENYIDDCVIKYEELINRIT